MREIVGKNLSSRLRKDLDQVAERCAVPLKSCRRQVRHGGCGTGLGDGKKGRRERN